MAKDSTPEMRTFYSSRREYRAQLSVDKCVNFQPDPDSTKIASSYSTSNADEIKRLEELAAMDGEHLRTEPFGTKRSGARPMSRQAITTAQSVQG